MAAPKNPALTHRMRPPDVGRATGGAHRRAVHVEVVVAVYLISSATFGDVSIHCCAMPSSTKRNRHQVLPAIGSEGIASADSCQVAADCRRYPVAGQCRLPWTSRMASLECCQFVGPGCAVGRMGRCIQTPSEPLIDTERWSRGLRDHV